MKTLGKRQLLSQFSSFSWVLGGLQAKLVLNGSTWPGEAHPCPRASLTASLLQSWCRRSCTTSAHSRSWVTCTAGGWWRTCSSSSRWWRSCSPVWMSWSVSTVSSSRGSWSGRRSLWWIKAKRTFSSREWEMCLSIRWAVGKKGWSFGVQRLRAHLGCSSCHFCKLGKLLISLSLSFVLFCFVFSINKDGFSLLI